MAVSQKRHNYSQKMARLWPQGLRACTVIHLKGPAKDSNEHPHLPLTFQAPLDLLDHMRQVAELLAQQPRHVAEPSLILGPIQN